MRAWMAVWMGWALVGCDCVAGGIEARGDLHAEVAPMEPVVLLCREADGDRCVGGEVTEGEWGLQYEVRQMSSAGGDQNRECDYKRWLVIEADNCERYTREIEGRTYHGPVQLDCS